MKTHGGSTVKFHPGLIKKKIEYHNVLGTKCFVRSAGRNYYLVLKINVVRTVEKVSTTSFNYLRSFILYNNIQYINIINHILWFVVWPCGSSCTSSWFNSLFIKVALTFNVFNSLLNLLYMYNMVIFWAYSIFFWFQHNISLVVIFHRNPLVPDI